MAATNRGLGKGLDALFKGYVPEESTGIEIQHLPLNVISPNAGQPRQEFQAQALQELSQSIKEQGVLQPILVRKDKRLTGRYEIVAGERRWRASKLAGLTTIPALIREISDQDSLVIALVENLQREDLNPIEEAEALSRLKKQLNLPQEELAKRVGKSRPTVTNAMRLLQLDSDIREAIREGELSAAHGRTLLGITDKDIRHRVFEYILQKGLSVRDVEAIVTRWKESGKLPGSLDPGSSRSRTRDPFVTSLQDSLTRKLGARIKVSGSAGKGRIVLSYRSQKELHSVLALLGLDQGDVSHET